MAYSDVFTNKRESAPFNGFLMRGDLEVARIRNDSVCDFSKGAPLYIQNEGDFKIWLQSRVADLSRSNIRIILKVLGLSGEKPEEVVKSVRAATVTDSFWLKGVGEDVRWKDVKFSQNKFLEASLKGDSDIFSIQDRKTPELTNIGSFNKGWQLRDDGWYLIKSGTELELFSELFVSKLTRSRGFDSVDYWIENGFIVCKNFVQSGFDFEPAFALIGSNTNYDYNSCIFESFGLSDRYMDLLFQDAIVRNPDRHEFNYGFLTTPEGTIEMAPNFDNNLALFSRGIPSRLERDDVLVRDFIKILREFPNYNIPKLTRRDVECALEETLREVKIDVNSEVVVNFCMNAYRRVLS